MPEDDENLDVLADNIGAAGAKTNNEFALGGTATGSIRFIYSPDVKGFALEGNEGVFSTVASFIVGPLRLVMRVMHNVAILPANLLTSYSTGVIIIGVALLVLGLIDYFVFHKWVLFVSQIPVILIGLDLKRRAASAMGAALEKREVNIDTSQVEDIFNGVYDELDYIIGKESK